MRDRLRFALFTTNSPGGPPGTRWNHPNARQHDYRSAQAWIRVARTVEAAKFDAIFWADHTGVYDTYERSRDTAVRQSVQFPINDPSMLVPAMAAATEHLGFAFSANVIQEHPFNFARRLSTLDHLTGGRIAWNIVTSFQRSSWRNFGYDEVADHAERYARAEEYVQVLYKLMEGSWEDGAVIADLERGAYADPAKVHEIDHAGRFYKVVGPHCAEPSPQRLPVLFQAGTSPDGRAFSARNAEALFIAAQAPRGAAAVIDDMSRRLETEGRRADDLLVFQSLSCVVGATEDEAARKNAELAELVDVDTNLAYTSTTLGVDLSTIDLDAPVGELETNAMQGKVRALAEAAPDKSWTFREIVMRLTANRVVGTGEQIADHIEEWADAGVTGINLSYVGGIDDIKDFIAHVVPELQRRGLMQTEYAPGTLREKLIDGSGPCVDSRHPAAGYRRGPAN